MIREERQVAFNEFDVFVTRQRRQQGQRGMTSLFIAHTEDSAQEPSVFPADDAVTLAGRAS